MSRFFTFILHSINDHNSYYPLLLTSTQINAAKVLDGALDLPGAQLSTPIHSLAYVLMSASRPEVAENQLQCPQILFLIFSTLRPDSTLETAEVMSKCLAKLSWGICATAVYEALRHRDEYPEGLLGYMLVTLPCIC
jgi:hypothetical protein